MSATEPTLRPSAHDGPRRDRHRTRRTIMRWLRRGLLALVGVAVLGLIVRAFLPAPVEVDVVAGARGPLEVTIEEDGRTRVRERYGVASPLMGELQRIELEPGQDVDAGAVLALVSPPSSALLDPQRRAEATARLAAARVRVSQAATTATSAAASRASAARDLARAILLHRQGALPRVELERAELADRVGAADLRAAELQREVAAAEVETARAVLGLGGQRTSGPLPIRAPIAGRVLRVLRENAGPVIAGEPLVELGDPHALEVVVDVLSGDAVRVAPGQVVRIEQWGGEATLAGRVRQVEPAAFTRISALGVEEQRVNVIVTLDAVPPSLGDGFRVEAAIVAWRGEDVLQVPASAIFRRDGRWAVFVVEDGRAVARTVDVGHRARRAVEIRSGLEPGALVVVYPGDRLTDGTRVVLRR